ncbi:hypothetical protein Klosneuvirus_2_97 [Klosneuvirus KNV1]|uniref:C2H2-type domain-containing protein n=1 Tax=Klosneuvirus KNV1 TaxID=1977640 RepID=A0A1V0SJ22_9VIRU|nr:hypothetical protein Klosneuvirus_2_97 [Klosneuvirus KNV1]
MKYNCENCNYETNDKSNYNRHLKSVAHLHVNANINSKLTLTVNSDRPSKFQCPKCDKTFTSAPGLSRHKNKFCKIDVIKDQIRDELKKEQELELELKKKDLEIEYKNKLLEKADKDNRELKQYIKTAKPATTYNISIKKMIQQTYPDAPHLDKLDDYSILHDDDTEFVQDLIYYSQKNRVHKYLGDIVIKYYKKDDPKDQSLWSTDSSRLKYIIKELFTTNNSYWSEDDKGLKINKYIIDPLLKYIHEYIRLKIDDMDDEIRMSKAFECIEISKKQSALSTIHIQIQNGTLKESIIKYIAPFFRFKTESNNLIKNE